MWDLTVWEKMKRSGSLYPSDASQNLHSGALLERSQTPSYPFPVKSNSLKQETCEEKEKPRIDLQMSKSFCTYCFCIYHNSWHYHETKSYFVSVTQKIPAVSPIAVTVIITKAITRLPSQT